MYQHFKIVLRNAGRVILVKYVLLNVLIRYLEKTARGFVFVHQWSSVILCMARQK